MGIHQTHAESNGNSLDLATVIVFVLRDGKVVEGREFFDDTARVGRFLGLSSRRCPGPGAHPAAVAWAQGGA